MVASVSYGPLDATLQRCSRRVPPRREEQMYRKAKQVSARAVREEFGEAMEKDSRSASKRF